MEIWRVLIESDWNLKQTNETKRKGEKKVLIESDWNLKYQGPYQIHVQSLVY